HIQRGTNWVVAYEPDGLGRTVSVTTPAGDRHTFDRDDRGRVTSVTLPAVQGISHDTTFEYDPNGYLTGIVRPDATRMDLLRDDAGRLLVIGLDEGDYRYARDLESGRLAEAIAPTDEAITFSWDGWRGVGLTWTDPTGALLGSLVLDHDDRGYIDYQRLGAGPALTFPRDADGLLTAAGAATITRDPESGLAVGVDLDAVSETTTWTPEGTPDGLSISGPTGSLFDASYDYDAQGRLAEATETVDGSTTHHRYRYDELGRLASVETDGVRTSLSYDVQGHAASATVDARDRVTELDGVRFTYTPNGDRATRTEGAAVTTTIYGARGQLREVGLPSGQRLEYDVDPMGRRSARYLDGVLTERYLWLGDQLLAVLEPSGALRDRFVYGDDPVPLYFERGGVRYRLVTDIRGSVRLVVDASTGEVAQAIAYDAWGTVVSDTNPSFQPLGYVGGLYEPLTGLVRFGARDYDPALGEWTSPDPVGFALGGANLYEYALGDPINLIDPTGLAVRP
ncbi:MAG: RHS repeat-associated core domain-containing protein, partial [Myxococcota bacterium]